MSQRKASSKTKTKTKPKPKPKRTRASSLQVYLSEQEIETLRKIAERREVTSSELVRTWIAKERQHEHKLRALRRHAKRKNTPPKSAAPEVEPVDPRQLRIVGAE